jgi:hypothetical protein
MHTVKVAKDEFVTVVTHNREEHRTVFEKALAGYHQRLLRELERRIHDLRRGRAVDVRISMPEPEDHTEDYDRVLTMARMSVDDVIELTAEDFAMYVMDQWHWKRNFAATAGYYL